MKNTIPLPAIERLSILHTVLDRLDKEGSDTVSSSRLGELTNVQPHTIRKDINYLGQTGGEKGYNVKNLTDKIERGLGFDICRKACIVGLGRLGSAIMDFSGFAGSSIEIVAGFDSSINRIETITSDIPLYPAYEITDIVKNMDIELGIIAVPPSAANQTAKRLIEGGIKGIINFAPAIIQIDDPKIKIRNMYVLGELRILSALISRQGDTPP